MHEHARRYHRGLVAAGIVLTVIGSIGLAACHDSAVGPQAQERTGQIPDPDPDPGTSAEPVSGIVYGVTTEGVQPLAGVAVWSFVFQESSGRTNGKVVTNGRGEYSIRSGLPSPGTLMIYASADGYGQPCVALHPIGEPTETGDVWLYSPAALSAPGWEPPPDHSVLVSGRIHHREVEGGEPRPIAGATVTLDLAAGLGVVGARTWTNGEGEYVLCYSPSGTADLVMPGWPAFVLQVTAPGFPGIILERLVEGEGRRVDFEF